MIIDKNQLSKKIGYIIRDENDLNDDEVKYIVTCYVEQNPILIKSKLPQKEFDLFCIGKLSDQELEKYI